MTDYCIVVMVVTQLVVHGLHTIDDFLGVHIVDDCYGGCYDNTGDEMGGYKSCNHYG